MTPIPPRARKALGQHFLVDPNIIRKIVDLAAVRPDETVLEIGPGRGALTRELCARAERVLALEVDAELGRYLAERLVDRRNLDLRIQDALTFPYHTVPAGTVVVANLPYYISSPLLFTLLEAGDRFARMVLMLQTEVARRLIARPGGREYGLLSVVGQAGGDLSLAFRVARTCFRPVPDVGSAVVSIRPHRPAWRWAVSRPCFLETLRAAFSHRRKTLQNSLGHAGIPSRPVAQALAEAGICGGRRAETLTVEEFAALADALQRSGAAWPGLRRAEAAGPAEHE